MLWKVDNKNDTPEAIVSYFTSKYGYIPDQVLVGNKVDIEFPSASRGTKFLVPDYHIKMR